jgi:hypothetical protein
MLRAMSPRLIAALILSLAALPAQAEVYKWVDANGQTHYSNAPPPEVKDKAQPVEGRISVMGMDPAVRAWAERRFAAQEQAEIADWQRRQQAMSSRYASYTPAPRSGLSASSYLSPYSSTYYSPYSYAAAPVFFATVPRTPFTRPRTGAGHRHPHHRR